MSSLFEAKSTNVMWAPLGVFAAILIILVVLLTLPFLVARLRRNPSIDRLFETLGRLIGAPRNLHQPAARLRPISRSTLRSLKVTQYKPSADPESLDADCCPICFCEYSEGQPIIKLVCSHYFHRACITRWLQRDATCPMCKACLEPDQQSSKELSSNSARSAQSTASTAASSARTVPAPAAATTAGLRPPPPAQIYPAQQQGPAAFPSIAAAAGASHVGLAAACVGSIPLVPV